MASLTLLSIYMSFEWEKAMPYQFLSFWLIWKLIWTRILAQSNTSYIICAVLLFLVDVSFATYPRLQHYQLNSARILG